MLTEVCFNLVIFDFACLVDVFGLFYVICVLITLLMMCFAQCAEICVFGYEICL